MGRTALLMLSNIQEKKKKKKKMGKRCLGLITLQLVGFLTLDNAVDLLLQKPAACANDDVVHHR